MNTIQMILENNLFRGIIGIIFLIGLCYFLSTDKNISWKLVITVS